MPKLNLKDIDNLMDDTYSRKQKIKRKKVKKEKNLQSDKVNRKKQIISIENYDGKNRKIWKFCT